MNKLKASITVNKKSENVLVITGWGEELRKIFYSKSSWKISQKNVFDSIIIYMAY